MWKLFKPVAALLAFGCAYFLVGGLIFLFVFYMNGGSIKSPMGWWSLGAAAFASAWAGYLGVTAGHAFLEAYFTPYPRRFVAIAFISILGLWFIPLTLIYISGAVEWLMGGDLDGWPPDGELSEYFVGLFRAVVAVIAAWILFLNPKNQLE